MKLNHQNFEDTPRGSAILIDLNEEKIDKNQRNFEDVSSESAIFEDSFKKKQVRGSKKPIVRRFRSIIDFFFMKRDYAKTIRDFFEDVSSESAIFDDLSEQGQRDQTVMDPPRKTKIKAIWLFRRNIVTLTVVRTSRARARFLSQHQCVQNVCATAEPAAGAGRRHI